MEKLDQEKLAGFGCWSISTKEMPSLVVIDEMFLCQKG